MCSLVPGYKQSYISIHAQRQSQNMFHATNTLQLQTETTTTIYIYIKNCFKLLKCITLKAHFTIVS